MQLVLNTYGLKLRVRNNIFRVSDGENVRDISPAQVSSIAITVPCELTSAAIVLATEADIPIHVYNRTGDAVACLRSPYFESLARLRRKQVYFSDRKEGGGWVVQQFARKTRGQLRVLKAIARRLPRLRNDIGTLSEAFEREIVLLRRRIQRPTPRWASGLMGWEGQMAKKYWALVGKSLPSGWAFRGRSRRPARDAFNVGINYFYGMLYALVEQALFGAGLDPHLGILHADEYDRPTLAYDLIEPFRPWVDHFVLDQIFTHKDNLRDCFTVEDDAWWLTDTGKRRLIPDFNAWMQMPIRWEGRQLRRQAHIHRAAAELARTINLTVERPQ